MTSGITSSYTTLQPVSEDPDTLKPDLTEESISEVKARPVPRPRSKIKHNDERIESDIVSSTGQTDNGSNTQNSNDDYCESPQPKPSPPGSTHEMGSDATVPADNLNKNEIKRSSTLPRPKRPPPPSVYYGRLVSTLKLTPTTSDNEDYQESVDSSASSNQQSPVSLGPSDEQENLFGIYRPTTEDSEKPAVPPRPPQPKQPYISSASLASQSRPPPPSFSPPPPPSEKDPLYSEIQFPSYLHVLPEHDEEMVNNKAVGSKNSLGKSSINSRYYSQRSNTAYTEEILEMLRWLKIVSKADMAPSLYGASLEEEIRSFHQTAQNVKKALRLFNLLMMKRNEALRDHISELTSVSEGLDKALKKKKTINIAGGTTGAVGGVTAVVGIALAPVTMGASLIATAVGAGMVASAGGVSAHVAKANKKPVTRDAVEELIKDYAEKVLDIEHCLNFILSGMNELRRYDIARLQRAGAQLDALKVAHLTQTVFNNINNFKRNPVANTGGMSSERLLQGFVKEMDHYFKEKEEQKLRKSQKSKFSGRVRLLAENLQDELDCLNYMWELFN